MLINGIGMNEMSPSYGGATKTTKAGDEVQFPQNVMKTLGQWDSYLAYDKWLSDIMTYASKR